MSKLEQVLIIEGSPMAQSCPDLTRLLDRSPAILRSSRFAPSRGRVLRLTPAALDRSNSSNRLASFAASARFQRRTFGLGLLLPLSTAGGGATSYRGRCGPSWPSQGPLRGSDLELQPGSLCVRCIFFSLILTVCFPNITQKRVQGGR